MPVNDEYEEKRPEADAFWPVQRRVVAMLFDVNTEQVVVANIRQDTQEATDCIVAGKFRVALRVRGFEYYSRTNDDGIPYKHEVTIRASDSSELAKVNKGLGMFNLYGFKSVDGKSFHSWSFGNLGAVKAANDTVIDPAYENHNMGGADYGASTTYPKSGQNPFFSFDVRQLDGYLIATTEDDQRTEIEKKNGSVQLWPIQKPFWLGGGK